MEAKTERGDEGSIVREEESEAFKRADGYRVCSAKEKEEFSCYAWS